MESAAQRRTRRRRELVLSHLGLSYQQQQQQLLDQPSSIHASETASDGATVLEVAATSVKYGGTNLVQVTEPSAHEGIAIVTINHPPVNSLSSAVMAALQSTINALIDEEEEGGEEQTDAIVIIGANHNFGAGADIPELQTMLASMDASPESRGWILEDLEKKLLADNEWLCALESHDVPIVAAIDGFALGGGLELAMACNGRVCTPNSRLGLPELSLGLIPGYAGTQRLPRLVGLEKALDMMLNSKTVSGQEALKLGLVQKVASSNNLLEEAISYAKFLAKEQDRASYRLPHALLQNGRLPSPAKAREIVKQRYAHMKAKYGSDPSVVHPFACLDAVIAGIQTDGKAGLQQETTQFLKCCTAPAARGLIHAFLAERQTSSSIPGIPANKAQQRRAIRSVGVIGGGLMGSGIATAILMSGRAKVVLKEVNQEFLEAGLKRIISNLDRSLRNGKLTKEQHEMLVSQSVSGTLDYKGFADVDMVIEAVIENLALKQEVFAELEKHCRQDCILASNTSTIPIDQIAAKTNASNRIIGTHFFSPAQVMPLLEIVRTTQVSPQVISDTLYFAQNLLRKTPIVVGNCPGFTVNRIFFPYFQAAALLVDAGLSPYRIDEVMADGFGMPMGVYRLCDLVGVDVITFINQTYAKAWPERVYQSVLPELMLKNKHFGQKTGKGFYIHSKGSKAPAENPVLSEWLSQSRDASRIPASLLQNNLSDKDIIELILFPVVNESCRVLEEGMVVRASDIDVGSILGYSFPRHKGGVLRWADDNYSSQYIHQRLLEFDRQYSQYCGQFFRPCEHLQQCAASGSKLSKRQRPTFSAQPTSLPSSGAANDVVIVQALRTPIGKAKRGLLKDTQPDDLLAATLTPLAHQMHAHGMELDQVGDVIVGSISTSIAQMRMAALLAGFPASVPVKKVDRLCSSGLQAIIDGAQAIQTGQHKIVIAGGVESMSNMNRGETPINEKAKGIPLLEGVYLPMGITSENVASRFNVTREEQDQFALQSQERAAKAQRLNKFKDELVPVHATVKESDGTSKKVTLVQDEGVRETTLDGLSKLKPAFSQKGTTTAGNASQVSDGASAVLMMTRDIAEAFHWEILGVLRGYAVIGCEPAVMGVGPALAIPKAVTMAGLTLDDIDLFEINEAFASQCHYCIKTLGLNAAKVNVNGGAVAMGHPLGCTGARLTATLLHEMKRSNCRYGVVSMCVGTGMGVAAVFERTSNVHS
ncbi:3-hydroxybutyryl-CoA epimerase [Balamuthia mandrillaris]